MCDKKGKGGVALRGTTRGFSLIELLIALAVVGILAAIAYPSYQAYLVRSNRAAAQSLLMDIAQRQQQYLLDARAYAPNIATLNVAIPAKVASVYSVTLVATAGPPPAFTATAAPLPGTRQAADGALSIDQAGAKTPADKW